MRHTVSKKQIRDVERLVIATSLVDNFLVNMDRRLFAFYNQNRLVLAIVRHNITTFGKRTDGDSTLHL